MLRLTRDSAIYSLGAVTGKAVAIVLVPIVTRALSPDDYGRLEVLSTLGSALVSILLLGIDRAALRLAFTAESDRRRLLASWYALAAAIVVPPALVAVALARPLSEAMFASAGYTLAVASVGAVVALGTFQFLALAVLRADRRPVAYAALSGGGLVLNAALVAALVLTTGATVGGVLAAYAVSLLVGAVVGVFLVRDSIRARPSLAFARRLLLLGLPLAPTVAAIWLAELANRAILLGTAGAAEVGFLGLGLRFASIASLAVGGLQLAWEPHAYAAGSSSAALARLANDARRALIGVATVVVAIALTGPELIGALSGPAYLPALPALGAALVAALAAALFVVTTTPSLLAGAMRDVGIASLAGSAMVVAGTLALAGPLGAAGAAAGLAFGQLAAALVAAWSGRRHPGLPVAWARTGTLLMLAAAVAVLATTLGSGPVERLALGLAFAAALYLEGSLASLVRRPFGRIRA